MGKNQTSQIPNILLSVKDASVAISVSSKMVRLLIASGRLKAVNLGKRMTRISLQELTDFAQGQGCNVVLPSSSLPFNNDKRERNKKNANAKPETGNVNKKAKCRITTASDIAPEGVKPLSVGIRPCLGYDCLQKKGCRKGYCQVRRGTGQGAAGSILYLFRHHAEIRSG